jgi:hypothetical protein
VAAQLSDRFVEALRDAGIAPEGTRRVVIDLQAGQPAKVHIERFGDERLLKVVQALDGIEIDRE